MQRLRRYRRPVALLGVSVAWMAGWGWAVTRRRAPLRVDRQVGSWLAVDTHWQDVGLGLLRAENPFAVVAATGILAGVALAARAPRLAVGVLAGVAIELVSVQWVIKPIVGRHEIAPGLSFPSSHVGAVTAVATAAVLVFRPAGPLGARLHRRAAIALAAAVGAAGLVNLVAVTVATIATSGHLVSDVLAVYPWAVAVPAVTVGLLDPPRPSGSNPIPESRPSSAPG